MGECLWWAAGSGIFGVIAGFLGARWWRQRALRRRRRARKLIRGLDHPAAASRDRTPSPVSRPAVTDTEPAYEYLLDIMLGGGLNLLREAMTSLINRYAAEGWSFYTISSDFKGAGGCWIVFRRRRESGKRGEDGE
ncbi:MAG: hypothetical protein KC900_14255 [Candidatus Omnitrophica bacterium]|nr:hypothetical protein [Candidatus Omnitrophota bacterium]